MAALRCGSVWACWRTAGSVRRLRCTAPAALLALLLACVRTAYGAKPSQPCSRRALLRRASGRTLCAGVSRMPMLLFALRRRGSSVRAAAAASSHAKSAPQPAASTTPTARRARRTPPAAGARASTQRHSLAPARASRQQRHLPASARGGSPARAPARRCGNDPYHAGGYGFTLQGDHNVRAGWHAPVCLRRPR